MTAMDTLWQWFWTAMILGSIGWYAVLLLYIGWHGGREIVQMTRELTKRPEVKPDNS
jgi:hypothetical protein